MSVIVNLNPPYDFGGIQPYPVASLWVQNRLIAQVLAGIRKKRVKTLPFWFPFNSYVDFSLQSQLKICEALQQIGLKKEALSKFSEVSNG
jgi:ABC-type phosphate/phosphonate transport system ATPase subunit